MTTHGWWLATLGILASCGSDGAAGTGGAAGAAGGAGASGVGAGGSAAGAGGAGVGMGGTGVGGAGAGAGGQGAAACAPVITPDKIALAVGARLAPGEDRTLCLRWTAPEDVDISGFVGTLGRGGHHALLLAYAQPLGPDGVVPCSEAELMDARAAGAFQMLAGTSYESDGVPYAFPSAPVQVGLHVPRGSQLVLDGHFLDATAAPIDACARLELSRGAPVVARLEFRTVLPATEYGLAVPAGGHVDVAYEEPAGGAFRIAAASSHMHEGGTRFRLSIKETDQTIYESRQWADPTPAVFPDRVLKIDAGQTFRIECSFDNPTAAEQRFPDQMCVGGMYLLSCALPFAC